MYIYKNRNPDGENIEDCVCRAISLATKMPYHEIERQLDITADLLHCESLCMCCYAHLIEDVYCFDRVKCRGLSVSEFADRHPYGIYIIRVEGHLTTVIAGQINDTWDCSRRKCDVAWRAE